MNCRARPRLRYSRLTLRGPDPADRAQLPLDRLFDAAEPVRDLSIGVAFHLRQSDAPERVVAQSPQKFPELVDDLRRELRRWAWVDNVARCSTFDVGEGDDPALAARARALLDDPRFDLRDSARVLSIQMGRAETRGATWPVLRDRAPELANRMRNDEMKLLLGSVGAGCDRAIGSWCLD